MKSLAVAGLGGQGPVPASSQQQVQVQVWFPEDLAVQWQVWYLGTNSTQKV